MAKTSKTHYSKSLLLLVLVILLLNFVSSSSARLLKFNGVLPQSQAATEPSLNLALPSETTSLQQAKNVFPCDSEMISGKTSEVEFPARLAGKYGPSTILNMLPKGQYANSGPSGGTNDVKN